MTTVPAIRQASHGAAIRDRGELWLLGIIVAVGALVRFSTLDAQSFWYDEAFTRAIVAHGLPHVFSTVARTESTPPLYYLLLWFWARVFGLSEVGLRSLSALIGTLTIPVMWKLGGRLISGRVGLAASALAAVSPLLFWYSQEARAYALLVLLSALTLLTMLRALERPDPRRLLEWSVTAALALCTHYFAAFLLIPEAAWLGVALHRRGALRPAVVAAGTIPAVAMGAALIPLLRHQNDGRASSLVAGGGSVPYRVGQLVRQDLVGFGQPAKKLVVGAAVLLALVAGAILVVGRRRAAWERVILPAVLAGGGVALALVISVATTDYFETRNLLATWPGLALVMAAGFGSVWRGRLATAALVLLCALSLVCIAAVDSDPSLQRPDWRGAAAVLPRPSSPRAIVGDRLAPRSLQPYLSGLSAYPAGTPVREIDVIDATASQDGGDAAPVLPTAPPTGFRLARTERTASYLVRVFSAPAARPVPVASLLGVGPPGGQDRAMLQR